jgi:hypothetical protein
MALHRLVVVGMTPLLTHNPAAMATPRQGKGREIPSPEDEAETGTYRLANGSCGIPGVGFRNGVVQAAAAWRQPRGRQSFAPLLEHIVVEEDLVELHHADGSPLRDFEIDRRRVLVQRQGVLRSRPKFSDWGCYFTISYDEVLLTDPDVLTRIAADAGARIGVGDYRGGGKKGSFGRYAVIDALPIAAQPRQIPDAGKLVALARAA